MNVPITALHELACTDRDSGCVCAPPIHRLAVIDRHLDAAAKNRQRSDELVTGIEALLGKFSALPAVPLDVLDRLERAIVQVHAANLVRLPTYSDLGEGE